jgi:glyoxylase-like metal-dependent hydrolase (beta-lactamase superfamily II)
MTQNIKTINLGGVNCFLVKAGEGFILIDSGVSNKRAVLDKELENAGCQPGALELILLTHGDIDHTDNCAYLRAKYGAKIAMHREDAGMVETGDMSWNRNARPDKISLLGVFILLIGKLTPFFGTPGKFEKFTPDICVEDGQDLSGYGLEAKVICLPGHSKGSIGILTADGDLFCGDLWMNMIKPNEHFMIDNLADYQASVNKLKNLRINTVYPGHGKAFPVEKVLDKAG